MSKWMTWIGAMSLAACAAEPADDGGGSSSAVESGSSGAGSSGAEASASSSESGTVPFDLDCADPQPRLQFDGVTPSGWILCSDLFLHREDAVTCLVPDAGNCDTCDSDCTDAPLGRCMEDHGLGGCQCVYSCETDADCGDGRVCACTGAVDDVPRCVPAGCTTTADCGEGLCGISGSASCGFDAAVACLDASSECRRTTCDDTTECVCYASGGEYVCHDECFSGCG